MSVSNTLGFDTHMEKYAIYFTKTVVWWFFFLEKEFQGTVLSKITAH